MSAGDRGCAAAPDRGTSDVSEEDSPAVLDAAEAVLQIDLAWRSDLTSGPLPSGQCRVYTFTD